MFKYQLKYQKVLAIVVLILSALFFIYALGFLTDLYPLFLCKAYGGVSGTEYFDTVQPYNKALVTLSIVTIVFSLTPFIFKANTRRKYYLDNFISGALEIICFIFSSMFLIINTTKYKNLFLTTVDVEAYIKKCEQKGWRYSGTTIWFDLGYVIAIILLVCVLLNVFNYIWKIKLMKEEENLLKGKKDE